MIRVDPVEIALLTVWNPFRKSDTIEAHVEKLRGRRWTWWGRVYEGGKPPESFFDPARGAWSWFESLAHEAKVRTLVLYVTSFDSLHALHVDRIVRGLPSAEERTPRSRKTSSRLRLSATRPPMATLCLRMMLRRFGPWSYQT
jgi:hypothetical protein